MSIIGAVVSSNQITLIEGQKNLDGTVTLLKDEVFDLEKGDRHIAYIAIRDRVHDRLLHGVDKVVLKASSAGRFTGTQSALLAAELRGVFIAAVPRLVVLVQEHAKTLSKAGSRKISEHIKDETWWNENFSGSIRKTNREAAYLILAAG